MAENIVSKYIGDAHSTVGRRFMKSVDTGEEAVIELTPEYFSVWDYGKPSSLSEAAEQVGKK